MYIFMMTTRSHWLDNGWEGHITSVTVVNYIRQTAVHTAEPLVQMSKFS